MLLNIYYLWKEILNKILKIIKVVQVLYIHKLNRDI